MRPVLSIIMIVQGAYCGNNASENSLFMRSLLHLCENVTNMALNLLISVNLHPENGFEREKRRILLKNVEEIRSFACSIIIILLLLAGYWHSLLDM